MLTTAFSSLSLLLATVLTLGVFVEYLVLVPLKSNPGAKRLAFLLGTVLVLLLLTAVRILFGDYPGRVNLLSAFFVVLSISMAWLGRHIWIDQVEGARQHRNQDQHSSE